MDTTSATLLERLRQPGDAEAWTRFVQLYTPLLFRWAKRLTQRDEDAADLVQEIFLLLLQKLPEFEYQPGRSFRGWLHTVMVNKWRERQRRPSPIALADLAILTNHPAPDSLGALDEAEYRQYLVDRALQLAQAEFEPACWKACWEHVVSGRPASAIGAELGMTAGAVYVAKHRVLRRLRHYLQGLLD